LPRDEFTGGDDSVLDVNLAEVHRSDEVSNVIRFAEAMDGMAISRSASAFILLVLCGVRVRAAFRAS
jgi:hypothetical protein